MGSRTTAWDRLGDYLHQTKITGSIESTLYWDQNTRMPSGGASWRGEQLALLAIQLHLRQSSREYADLIQEARVEWSQSGLSNDREGRFAAGILTCSSRIYAGNRH